MRKGEGVKAQKRGHKRRAKVLAMKKNRNPNSVKPVPGEKWFQEYLSGN